MNKADIINHISGEAEISKADAEKAVNAMFQGIMNALGNGEDARFVGFGTFSVLNRKERTGRNPQTGEVIKIPATKVPKFAPGKEFKEIVK